MTDYKVGDKVRLTVEGKVTKRRSSGGFKLDTGVDEWSIDGPVDYDVEVLERASFPEGTVAISKINQRTPAVRGRSGWTPTTSWGHLTDDDIRTNKFFTVIHEPKD